MMMLYLYGQVHKYRVCGTGNKAERTVGYFTKWGDGACDFNPLGDLWVDEVVQIGDYLGLPHHLVHKTPSDGLCGKSDEENLGFSYDSVKDFFEGNTIDNDIKEKISNRVNRNYHKLIALPSIFYK